MVRAVGRSIGCRLLAGLTAATIFAIASAQAPPPHQSGITPIPTTVPPLTPLRTLPNPAGKIPSPANAAANSPRIEERLKQGPLTLNDALAIALADNPVLAQAGQNLYLAQGRVGEARSGFYPTLTASPGESYISSVAAPAYYIQATLPIDISQLVRAATQQAQFQEVGARLDVNRVRNEVGYQVQTSFFEALRSKALENVAQEDLTDSTAQLYDAQARYEAKAVAYIDVVRAQTLVANAQKNFIQAKSNVSNALAVLANRMGIDVSSDLTITDAGAVKNPPLPGEQPVRVPKPAVPKPSTATEPLQNPSAATIVSNNDALIFGPEYQSVLQEALAARPEILEDDALIAAAQKGVQVARRSELPSLGVSVGYYDLRTQSDSKVNQPQGFIGLNIPIFDAGLARARVQEARATVASTVTQRREQTDTVALEVRQAYLAVVQARDQVAVAQQAVLQARTAFSLAQVRYNTGVSSRAGISPLLELNDAQAALTQANQNQVNALYDYNDARAQLDRSAGRFAYVGNAPGYSSAPAPNVVGKSG